MFLLSFSLFSSSARRTGVAAAASSQPRPCPCSDSGGAPEPGFLWAGAARRCPVPAWLCCGYAALWLCCGYAALRLRARAVAGAHTATFNSTVLQLRHMQGDSQWPCACSRRRRAPSTRPTPMCSHALARRLWLIKFHGNYKNMTKACSHASMPCAWPVVKVSTPLCFFLLGCSAEAIRTYDAFSSWLLCNLHVSFKPTDKICYRDVFLLFHVCICVYARRKRNGLKNAETF